MEHFEISSFKICSMATRGETGWQAERTVLECNRYMLENEIATDVCFKVGPPDGEVVNIRAHKYMLISRSPVFEAMFCSRMSECNSGPDQRIRIEDIEANTFKDFLMYIYCEQANISPETSFPLMYAAKKYMVPRLVEMCRNNLEESINEYNACYLLEQSLVICEEQLAAKCLDIIAKHSDKFLSESELLSTSRQAMEVILGSNELRSCESLVHEFCLQWAMEQLLINQGIQNPTDEQIRETLGGLLYQIRFPIMHLEEFSKRVWQRNILSSDEKLSLYYYLATGTGVEQLLFCSQKRNQLFGRGEELWVDRVVKCVGGGWRGNKTDAIDFMTNEDVLLTGVGLYSGYRSDYIAQIEVLEYGFTVYTDAVTVPLTGNPAPYKTCLSTFVATKAGAVYTLSVSRPNNDIIAYYADACHRTCEKDSVNFRFSSCSQSLTRNRSQTTEAYGQIPRLYFKKV